jgi:hypothetical protein
MKKLNMLCMSVSVLLLSLTLKAVPIDDTESEPVNKIQLKSVQFASKDVFEKQLPDNLSEYNYIDPLHIVPTEPLTQALRYFKSNKPSILNQSYITIADMTQKSSKKRLFLVNMKTGSVNTFLVAHGKNSDLNDDGYADAFSNQQGSNMTSLGFYLTGETYSGKHGLSLKLYGLQSTNSNAYARAVVMHGADYVNPSHTGRSFGCPAIEMKYISTLIPALKGKSLLYIYKKAAAKKVS